MKNKTKIMVVLGTRPEAIKLAPVLLKLDEYPGEFKVDMVWTGQHAKLAKPFLKLFNLKPNFDLNIMKKNQTLADIVTRATSKLAILMKEKRPHLVMVQGDTTTAFISALCAYHEKIPVAHLEAGLRSYNPYHPFPEEKNRELISHLTKWHFAPTQQTKENLLREGTDPKSIYVVGNSVVDALQWLMKHYPPPDEPVDGKLLVVTAHRRESFGLPLENICAAIARLVKNHDDLKVVLPVHPNPRVKKVVTKLLGKSKQIHLSKPLDYLSFLHLLTRCSAVLTDSGGVQEEAPCLGKPVLITREVTERPEGVAAGASRLVGRDSNNIVAAVEDVLYNPETYAKMARIRYPFGRGNTAAKVVEVLQYALK